LVTMCSSVRCALLRARAYSGDESRPYALLRRHELGQSLPEVADREDSHSAKGGYCATLRCGNYLGVETLTRIREDVLLS
jgi:hypothetical protein